MQFSWKLEPVQFSFVSFLPCTVLKEVISLLPFCGKAQRFISLVSLIQLFTDLAGAYA